MLQEGTPGSLGVQIQFKTTPIIYHLYMDDIEIQGSRTDELKRRSLGKMAEAVMLLTCVQDVTGSNLGLNTNHLD
jgi:hypothetical protein